jgi:hypothetical protein
MDRAETGLSLKNWLFSAFLLNDLVWRWLRDVALERPPADFLRLGLGDPE